MRKDLVRFWLTLKTFLDNNLSYAAKWEHDALFFFAFFPNMSTQTSWSIYWTNENALKKVLKWDREDC